MTRAQYRTLPADKVAFYRAARKDVREMRTRTGTAKRLARLLASQDAREVVIRLPEGGERRLAREMVKEMSAPVSVMPPMEAILTRREIRDVVAYLGTLKAGKGGKGEKGGKR